MGLAGEWAVEYLDFKRKEHMAKRCYTSVPTWGHCVLSVLGVDMMDEARAKHVTSRHPIATFRIC